MAGADRLITFGEAALIVPRDTLRQAVDCRKLTLYRRGRTLLVSREQVVGLQFQEQPRAAPDMSILNER